MKQFLEENIEVISLVLKILVLVSAVTFFILATCGVILLNAFQLGFAILTLGWGATFFLEAFLNDYPVFYFPIGAILFTAGVVIVLIGVLAWYFILIIAVAMLLVGAVVTMGYLCSCFMPPNDDDGHVPFEFSHKESIADYYARKEQRLTDSSETDVENGNSDGQAD